MRRQRWVDGAAVCVLLAAIEPAAAQITSAPDFKLGPPAVERYMGKEPENARPPSPDPRDINGVYIPDMKNGFGQATTQSGVAGTGPVIEDQSLIECVPEAEVGGSPYAMQIIQTPGRVTFIYEYNHVVRRIYIDEALPPNIEPSYSGYSVGRWEGDRLLIETRGLKGTKLGRAAGMVTVTRLVERVVKTDGGRRIEVTATSEGIDKSGKRVTAELRNAVVWRSDLRLTEFICEDGAGQFFNQ